MVSCYSMPCDYNIACQYMNDIAMVQEQRGKLTFASQLLYFRLNRLRPNIFLHFSFKCIETNLNHFLYQMFDYGSLSG